MANESITFCCSACGIKLTVPGSLAGVFGPCPSCGSRIQAPSLVQVLPGLARPGDSPPVPPAVGHLPEATPLPPAAIAAGNPGSALTPVPQAIPATPVQLPTEPRQTTPPTETLEPLAKPEQESLETSGADALGTTRKSGKRLPRMMVPLLFILPLIALVFGVLTLLKDQGSDASATSEKPAAPSPSHPMRGGAASQEPALPVPAPLVPEMTPPASEFPADTEAVDPGNAARVVLEKFLTAITLAERLPLMETRTTGVELAKSCLASPLPAASNIVQDYRQTNPDGDVIDFYFNVDFDAGDNRQHPHTILVRKRDNRDPMVAADSFLDLYGGRLAAFAAAPSGEAEIFQVIAYAEASCSDENIPNHETKFTLKLLPRENADEIARAIFGQQSRIARMLKEGTHDLKYGKAHPSTVMLRWNSEENPETPYLEAIDIKSLDWKP